MAGPVRFPNLVTPGIERRPGDGIGELAGPAPAPEGRGPARPFSAYLQHQIREVNRVHVEADQAVAAVATGQSGNLHEAMIALDKADVSFRLMTRVRNKCVEAYQEIMRMGI